MNANRSVSLASFLTLVLVLPGCATFEPFRTLVQAPEFDEASGQPHEFSLLPPALDLPLGGARVRLWTRVTNPNRFGLTLGTLRGTLYLEETSAATADFPLGLPLEPQGSATVPIDLTISFRDVPGLADIVRRALRHEEVMYRLQGTIGVDAGPLGTPTFGPMTFLRGSVRPSP